jgi:hypothetical protein
LTIDRKTGLIRSGSSNGRPVIEGGPFLNLGQGRPKVWVLEKMDVRELARSIVIAVSGASEHAEKNIDLQFDLEAFGDGRMDLRYRLATKPEVTIDQLGMSFCLPASVDRLTWHRQALWSVYPDDHIGRPSGTAHRTSPRSVRRARVAPDWPWAEEMQEPFLDGYRLPAGAATNDFRSLKEDVFWAGCFQGETLEHLRVEAQGEVAVRASPDSSGQVDLSIYNFWRYSGLGCGNYVGPNRSTAFVEQTRPIAPAEHKISLRIIDNVEGLVANYSTRAPSASRQTIAPNPTSPSIWQGVATATTRTANSESHRLEKRLEVGGAAEHGDGKSVVFAVLLQT